MPAVFTQSDSRLHPPTLQARLVRLDDGKLRLEAPTVGLYRGEPPPGSLVAAGGVVGQLEILGVLHHLIAPAGATGLVLPNDRAASRPSGPDRRLARRPVGHGDLLVALDPDAGLAAASPDAAAAALAGHGALVYRAPTSGRFYTRTGPGKPPLVQVGETIRGGQAIALIEVMKTFSRLHYGGDGLPDPARVRAILVRDEEDVAAGQALLELEPA
jgi:acetyl-CoA carboxylase biotin carboxyl carrier protein